MVSALAGLALFAVISQSMVNAYQIPSQRDAATITLLITLSGVSFLGLASPFWGLAGGLLLTLIDNKKGNH